MKKLLTGLVLSAFAGTSFAQSVLSFDVVFDTVYEASGQFAPTLGAVQPGPFNGNAAIAPPNLTGHVILSSPPSSTTLTNAGGALNQITLNGSFSTASGYSPSSGWSTHTFSSATYDLYKPNSYFATDFVGGGNNWPIFTATAANGALSDQGPASIYGGTCPYFNFPGVNCASAQSAGTGTGATPYGLFAAGTQIYNGSGPVFPTLANAGNYALIGGSYSQTNPGAGLGFENGMDAFAFQGVLDTLNSQGNGASQPYPDGVLGFPGKVRFLTFSTSGNTAYMVEGHVVPVPAAVWLFGSALGLLGAARRRVAA